MEIDHEVSVANTLSVYCRTGADRSCLYCAVSILVEKMEIEYEVSVVNTLRQIKARRISAISSAVSVSDSYCDSRFMIKPPGSFIC